MAEYPDRQPAFTPPGPAYAPDRSDQWPDGTPRTADNDGREQINASDGSQPTSLVTLRQLGTAVDGVDTKLAWEDVGTDVPPLVGGIQFDTAPQIGDWLSIRTTGTAPDTVAYSNDYSISLWAHDAGDGSYPGGIDLIAENPNNPPNEIQVGAMNSYNVGIGIYAHEGLDFFNSGGGTLHIRNSAASDPLLIEATDNLFLTSNKTTNWYGDTNYKGAIHLAMPHGSLRVEAAEGVYIETDQGTVSGRASLKLSKNPSGPGGPSDAELQADEIFISSPAVHIGYPGGTIGFFTQSGTGGGVAQPAHPVTLADVINALTSLGLTA